MTRNCTQHRLAPWRRSFQGATALLLLALPFITLDGQSLLRIDLGSLSLFFFGGRFHIEELYLLLLALLFLLLLFLLSTQILGRIWCGWACPQTLYSDLIEAFERLIGLVGPKGQGRAGAKILLLHLFCLGLAVLTACIALWYFMAPWRFAQALLRGELPAAAWGFLALVALPTYLNLAFIRRLMCREFCPYGRFQSVLVDPGTLVLHLPREQAHRCTGCRACVRACPMGIDIRRGYQIECINCGRCLDACADQFAPRGEKGLIRYSFGTGGRGFRALLNLRLALLLLVTLALGTGLFYGATHRAEADMQLALSKTARSRILPGGAQATFFNVSLANHTDEVLEARLEAQAENGEPIELKGPATHIRFRPQERLRLDVAALSEPVQPGDRPEIGFILRSASGEILARASAKLLPP